METTYGLEDLCGEKLLQGVDLTTENVDGLSVNAVRFMLDNVTYLAVENPSDGYRSWCEDLIVSERQPVNAFPGVRVIGTMKPDDKWNCGDEVLTLIDAITGKVVLEVGTLNTNDYYPYCHFEYHPENMFCNQ